VAERLSGFPDRSLTASALSEHSQGEDAQTRENKFLPGRTMPKFATDLEISTMLQ
jgi:hypothetical protein